jgi:hypothetical protein
MVHRSNSASASSNLVDVAIAKSMLTTRTTLRQQAHI